MQFHRNGTDPTPSAHLVCRNGRWHLLAILAILWAAPVFWWCVAAPWWVTGLCGVLPALLTWPLVGVWRKRGRRDNWVLAVADNGVWLNFRDCEYHDAAPGDSVVFVAYGEIAVARRVTMRYTTPSGNGGTTYHRNIYLELQLTTFDISQLRQVLAAERERQPPERRHFGGLVTSRAIRRQAAIEMEGLNAIRIKFSAANYSLRPSLRRVLTMLERFICVEVERSHPATEWQALGGAEFDDLVRRLAVGGQRIEAMSLLEHRKGLSTTEAVHVVDEICDFVRSAPTKDLPLNSRRV